MKCKCGTKLGVMPNISRIDWVTPICSKCAREEVLVKLGFKLYISEVPRGKDYAKD